MVSERGIDTPSSDAVNLRVKTQIVTLAPAMSTPSHTSADWPRAATAQFVYFGTVDYGATEPSATTCRPIQVDEDRIFPAVRAEPEADSGRADARSR